MPGFPGGAVGGVERPAGGDLVEEGEAEDGAAAQERHPPEPGMEDEAGDEEDRRPGQVAEGQDSSARQELPQHVHVPQRRLMLRAGPEQRSAMGGIEDRVRDLSIEDHAAAHQQPRAQHLQRCVDREAERRDQGEPDQRRLVATGQHPVVDLQHVERAHEEQEVGEEPEDHGGRKNGLHRAEPVVQHRVHRLISHPPAYRQPAKRTGSDLGARWRSGIAPS